MPKIEVMEKEWLPQQIEVRKNGSLPVPVGSSNGNLNLASVAPMVQAETLQEIRAEEERKQRQQEEEQRRQREAMRSARQPVHSTD